MNGRTDLASLASVGRVTGSLRIEGLGESDLASLSCLRRVDGGVLLRNNQGLTSLAGLEGLNSVALEVAIYFNPDLGSVGGLSGLSSLGALRILGNDSLTGVDLPNLQMLGELEIGFCQPTAADENHDNPELSTLEGLGGLESLGSLTIGSQTALTSLAPMPLLAAEGGLDGATISQNANLPFGEVEALQSALGMPMSLTSCGNLDEPAGNACTCPPGGA